MASEAREHFDEMCAQLTVRDRLGLALKQKDFTSCRPRHLFSGVDLRASNRYG
jgi:hypothetical protein